MFHGEVSQSLQLAPFDADYELFNSSTDITVHDPTLVRRNTYLGGPYQQAASYIALTPDAAYELSSQQFATYGQYTLFAPFMVVPGQAERLGDIEDTTARTRDSRNCHNQRNGADSIGFEMYSNPDDRSSGYVAWQSNGKRSWTLHSSALRANPVSEVSQRLISEEPMAMILNFGSKSTFSASSMLSFMKAGQLGAQSLPRVVLEET